MEVILLERVVSLGAIGDVVKVRDGYARNFLLPLKKALRATKENKAAFEARKAQIAADNAARKGEAEKTSAQFEGVSVAIVRQASEDGKLYGSVVARDVADALKAQKLPVERQQVELKGVVKNIGAYEALVTLHPEVVVTVTVNVVRSEAAASGEDQAA